jgi:hypothetical protein
MFKFFTLLLTFISTVCAEEYLIPKGNQVILSKTLKLKNVNTKQILTSIIKYLKIKNKNKEIKKLLYNFNKYNVQFIIMENNIILCNFFKQNKSKNNWKQHRIIVKDGGFWYWNIKYDTNLKKCTDLSINGYS